MTSLARFAIVLHVLKPEHETAVSELLRGSDVMAVLPTGFGKSMIFTVFSLARLELSASTRTCIVISPLKSIIERPNFRDVVAEPSLQCMELTSDKINFVRNNPPQFLYCSAQAALKMPFELIWVDNKDFDFSSAAFEYFLDIHV